MTAMPLLLTSPKISNVELSASSARPWAVTVRGPAASTRGGGSRSSAAGSSSEPSSKWSRRAYGATVANGGTPTRGPHALHETKPQASKKELSYTQG